MNAIITTPYTIYICMYSDFSALTEMYRNHGGCPCVCESPALA